MGSTAPYVREMRRIWRHSQGANKSRYFPATDGFQTLIANQKKENIKNVPIPVKNWITILDEFGLYIYTIYLICFHKGFMNSYKRSTKEIVDIFLWGGIVTQTVVIRELALSGFDAAAKHSSRLLAEYVDIFNYLQVNPQIAEEFHSSHQTPHETNAFWHKHISKGKLRVRVLKDISEKFPEMGQYLQEMEGIRTEEWKVISAFAHPSFMAAFTSAVVGATYDKGGSGILGRPDLHSVRTLRFVFYSLVELLMFNYSLQFADFAFFPKNRRADKLTPFIVERRPFIRDLMLWIIMNIDHRDLSVPDDAFGRRHRKV